jgi:hypothetical protein
MAGEVKLYAPRRALHAVRVKPTTSKWLGSACVALAFAASTAVAIELVRDPPRALIGPTDEESVQATAETGVELFLSRNWSKLSSLYTPKSIFKEPANSVRRIGAQAIVAELKLWHKRYRGLTGRVLSTDVSGDTAVLHMAWSGRQNQPSWTGDGTYLPVGEPVTLTSWVLIVVRDGKIASTEHSLNRDELASPDPS